jgi:hypothetical protein
MVAWWKGLPSSSSHAPCECPRPTDAGAKLTGDHIRACRHARELVADMHWWGLPVPPLYARMAAEFEDLVTTGAYAAWVASGDGVG